MEDNRSPNNRALNQTGCNHSPKDWERFSNLIYKPREYQHDAINLSHTAPIRNTRLCCVSLGDSTGCRLFGLYFYMITRLKTFLFMIGRLRHIMTHPIACNVLMLVWLSLIAILSVHQTHFEDRSHLVTFFNKTASSLNKVAIILFGPPSPTNVFQMFIQREAKAACLW